MTLSYSQNPRVPQIDWNFTRRQMMALKAAATYGIAHFEEYRGVLGDGEPIKRLGEIQRRAEDGLSWIRRNQQRKLSGERFHGNRDNARVTITAAQLHLLERFLPALQEDGWNYEDDKDVLARLIGKVGEASAHRRTLLDRAWEAARAEKGMTDADSTL